MIRIPQLLRTQCRRDLRPSLAPVQKLLTRSRTGARPPRKNLDGFRKPPRNVYNKEADAHILKVDISSAQVPDYFAGNAFDWLSGSTGQILDRLERFGLPKPCLKHLLKAYVRNMEKGIVFQHLKYNEEQLERMAYDLSQSAREAMDQYYTRMLFEWACTPAGEEALQPVISNDALSRMQGLHRAADLSKIGWQYDLTRRNRPRKFIMHVGPTNSGKTHNALRALAAARRGIYAGPLRLLAYEIYERLNKGQIVPLGAEPEPETEPDSFSNIDLGEAAVTGQTVVVTKTGNPKYARACNMLTGEEQKVVEEGASLLSCTVEMTPHTDAWDVAVVDEIQLIADRNRGGAWTNAVVGLNAAEIHLCGEESAIPVIEAIVHSLGDSLEINRYERLTPLVVAEQSLEGKLKRIEKGDCAVAFSRTGIFNLKNRIEKETKMRCALAYGRLPPEIRSEQAALFNDPNSDYHVLVGSDAVGMGLNLKIKRVVFEAVSKWDGGRSAVLSTSQIKQIAGRAGRFGLHGAESAGGVVTTLHPEDLEIVRKALASPYEPIRHARLPMTPDSFSKVLQALPLRSSQKTVADVFRYVAKIPPRFVLESIHDMEACFRFVDEFMDCLTASNRLIVQLSPCPWRDDRAIAGAKVMMDIYRDKLRVPIEDTLLRSGLLKHLNATLLLMEDDSANCEQTRMIALLGQLETIHKVIVLYLWYTYRAPLAFPDQIKAFKLRQLTEVAIDWCLEAMHAKRLGTASPAAEARKRVLERRPLAKTTWGEVKAERRKEKVAAIGNLLRGEYAKNLVR
ncbi:P-loop containing nucleoside triphosphate hydrolase protein [Trametes cingulata]|nr:P-loop containing nucleoside triphosphate hydrolase protein [Trametes cingulata]